MKARNAMHAPSSWLSSFTTLERAVVEGREREKDRYRPPCEKDTSFDHRGDKPKEKYRERTSDKHRARATRPVVRGVDMNGACRLISRTDDGMASSYRHTPRYEGGGRMMLNPRAGQHGRVERAEGDT